MKYPEVDYPTVVAGYIEGPLRWESLDGDELWFGYSYGRMSNITPLDFDGKTWGITHLQKKSRWGWLLMRPFCFHAWYFSKLQKQDVHGNWIPGTEKGWYVRTPGWRWDIAGTMIDGVLRHWIFTKGYFGRHWD